MQRTIPVAHPPRRLFTAITERSFRYLTELLVDFTHIDNLYKIRNAQGRPVDEVVEMLPLAPRERGGGGR